jgi:hypothetical protein
VTLLRLRFVQPLLFFFLIGAAQAKPPKRPAAPRLVPVPALPKLPAKLSFRDELAGRRAYWAARDAAHTASFQCELSFLQDNRGRLSPEQTATETLYASGNKLSLSYASGVAGRRSLRRAISDGESLLAVSFEERNTQTTREFSRLYFTETGPLWRALPMARLSPLATSCGAQLAIEPARAMQPRLWKDTDGSVLEVDSLVPRPGRPHRVRRYRFTVEHTLSLAEEWEVREGRTTYRKETYKPAPKLSAPFDQTLPENYIEKPLKLAGRPPEPPPVQVDPQALALLAKWEKAHQRFFTLHATATVTTKQLKRTDISRDPGQGGYNGTYELWLQRPGSALVTIQGVDSFPVTQTLRADGTQIIVEDTYGKKRSSPLREGARLETSLRQAALRSALEPLQWLLEGPPTLTGYDAVRLLSPVNLPDGTVADVIELIQTTRSTARDRPVVSEIVDRIWLSKDGLPVGFETTRKTTYEGLFERDQPPTSITAIQLRGVATDREPPF